MGGYDYYERLLDPTPQVRKLSGPFTEQLKTVAEAVAFCEREGLPLDEVRMAHNYVSWERYETPEEIERRIASAKASRDKHLAAIDAMHADYVARGLLPTTPTPTERESAEESDHA